MFLASEAIFRGNERKSRRVRNVRRRAHSGKTIMSSRMRMIIRYAARSIETMDIALRWFLSSDVLSGHSVTKYINDNETILGNNASISMYVLGFPLKKALYTWIKIAPLKPRKPWS